MQYENVFELNMLKIPRPPHKEALGVGNLNERRSAKRYLHSM